MSGDGDGERGLQVCRLVKGLRRVTRLGACDGKTRTGKKRSGLEPRMKIAAHVSVVYHPKRRHLRQNPK
eukprot:scaffold35051_cov65-Phaeocystis_antarctica.AAC.1